MEDISSLRPSVSVPSEGGATAAPEIWGVVVNERQLKLKTQRGRVVARHGDLVVLEHHDFASDSGRPVQAHKAKDVAFFADYEAAAEACRAVQMAFDIEESAVEAAVQKRKQAVAAVMAKGSDQ